MAALLEELVKTLEALELWMKLIKKTPQDYVDPTLDPVLLVPGIAGSILNAVDEKTGNEERIWVRILGADHEFRTKLWSLFDPSTGETISIDRGSRIEVPEDRFGLYAIDVLDPDMIIGRESVYYFHDMIVEMLKWGYQEGKTLFGFGYDFRQSNRFQGTLERFAAKLESVYTASGGKKINIISHSMGGLLVKCFLSLHSDIFEKYVKSWIAIAAPFRGAPGYITSTLLNGMSFVEGWQQNFFISKWSMHQLLIECPSIYELMPCPDFHWENPPLLEVWREKTSVNGNSTVMLESFPPVEAVPIFTEALACNMASCGDLKIPLPFNMEILRWSNETRKVLSSAKVPQTVKFYNIYGTNIETPHTVCYGSEDAPVSDLRQLPTDLANYVNVDGDGTVPVESAKADGLNAEARVGVPGEHREILCDRHVFRIVKHWLRADNDPFYNPINDYVILPTAFEIERFQEKGLEVTSLKEEWEMIEDDSDEQDEMAHQEKPLVASVSVSHVGGHEGSREEACGTIVVHPQHNGKKHVELNAMSLSANA
ncbi:lecithin-cholesterol acyltransferase-like 4 [Coffea arabica]|uniref:Lecithin-cholesterol acyltransferase-like 4 n=1 Tax=Coffea arabica TaxID=13443 RepID=A0A6P6UE35_COFAR|nr:lecithin-cholesterol acyltransferase-like 4 [Coffea arabica]